MTSPDQAPSAKAIAANPGDAPVGEELPSAPASAGPGLSWVGWVVGGVYGLLNAFFMAWVGYGGLSLAGIDLPFLVIGLGYFIAQIGLIQGVLWAARPSTRRAALLGFLAPWVLLDVLFILPQFSEDRFWSTVYILVPLFALLLNWFLELGRAALWPKNKGTAQA